MGKITGKSVNEDFIVTGDTSSYTGKSLYTLRVNASEDGLDFIKHNWSAVVPPTVNDDVNAGYAVGSIWLDQNLEDAWYCFNNAAGEAVWSKGTAFWELTDTPASSGSPNYVGYENNSVRVNAAGDGIEYQKHNIGASTAPTIDNDITEGYTVSSRWLDLVGEKEYVCKDNSDGAAVWIEVTGGGGTSSPLTTKGDLYTYDTDNQRLAVGADGKVLKANSSEATGLEWADESGASPLTTKGDIHTYDTADQRLAVGSDGKILKANSATSTGLEWADESAGDPSPLTTKGDIYTYDTDNQRLPIGADGKILKANSATDTGLEWADESGGAFSLDEAYNGGDSITVDGNPVTLNRTQSADDQESLEIAHDFNSSQGAIIKITGSNSGDGTPNDEYVGALSISVEKRLPSVKYYYAVSENDFGVKVGDGSWDWSTSLPDSPNDLAYVHGTSNTDLWVCGQGSSVGYIAHNTGSGFVRDTTHPMNGINAKIFSVFAVSSDEVWTVSQDRTGGGNYDYRIHKWTSGTGWVQKYSVGGSTSALYRRIVKVGDHMATGSSSALVYSNDAGETWARDTSTPFQNRDGDCGTNPITGRLRVAAKDGASGIILWEGFTGGTGEDAWTQIGSYSPGNPSPYGTVLWTSQYGNAFYHVGTDNSDLIYNFDTTPTKLDMGSYAKGLFGLSETEIMWADGTIGSGGAFRKWDGASITTEAFGASNIQRLFAYEALAGTGTFGLVEGSFTGAGGSNDAVFIKGGSGITHVIKSVSGKIELDNGVIILGEQSETPSTPTNKGVIYTKEVSGETEFFYLGTDGNEVQLTSGGSIIGSSPLTTKGDIYTYDTDNQRLPIGTDGKILSADSSEATGLKWIDNTGGGYEVIDNFDDSSIHERWTVEEPGDATVVEGSDGIVLTMPDNSINVALIEMDLPSDMHNRNWIIQVHMTTVLENTEDAMGMYMRIYGQGGGAEKYFGMAPTIGIGKSLAVGDSGGEVTKSVTDVNTVWIRIRRFGDEIRTDYYVGLHTTDPDTGGYWQEYDSSRAWYIVPKSGTYDYPVFYEKLKFFTSQWSNQPGFTATLRKFKLQIF
jgi:hypothetical protein